MRSWLSEFTHLPGLLHISLYNKSGNLGYRIGTDGNGLLEMTGKLVRSIVGNIYNACITRLDRFFRKGGNSAAATGKCLMDNQGSRTGIPETETALDDRLGSTELTEVVTQCVKLYLGIVLGLGITGNFHFTGTYFLFLNLCTG